MKFKILLFISICLLLSFHSASTAQIENYSKDNLQSEWPVLTTYDQDHIDQIAMPIGGIGTGCISIGGRGELRHWEIVNRPNKEFVPRYSFFTLFAKPENGPSVTRLLEGKLQPPYSGPFGSTVKNHGLPRFQQCSFLAAYPFGQVLMSDPEVPVNVRIQAFNPLIPGDPNSSEIPVAIIRFVLTNKMDESVRVSVCGSLLNFIGTDGIGGKPEQNKNYFQKEISKTIIQGLFMNSAGVDSLDERFGTMSLVALGENDVSYRTSWAKLAWANALLDFWDDFSADGVLEERENEDEDAPQGSLAATVNIPAGSSKSVTFLLAWHFPNRQTWTPVKKDETN